MEQVSKGHGHGHGQYQEDGPYLDQSKRQGLCLGQGFGQGKDECQSKIQNKGDLIKFNEIVQVIPSIAIHILCQVV